VLNRAPAVTSEPLSTSDKIALHQQLQRGSDSKNYQLLLEPPTLERALRSAAELAGGELHSQIELSSADAGQLIAAVKLPLGVWMNASLAGTAKVEEGRATVHLTHLKIGRIPIPSIGGNLLVQPILDMLLNSTLADQALQIVSRMKVEQGKIELVVSRKMELVHQLAGQFQSEEDQERAEAARQTLEHWLAHTRLQTVAEEDSFVVVVRELFQSARAVSSTQSASDQNQTALLAGGIALGHPRIAKVIGIELSAELAANLQAQAKAVRCYGRQDLVQHFWLSASLATAMSSRVSNFAGRAKEEMDSGAGGSGFSFADLQADRAGVRLAEAASPQKFAQQVQQLIAGEWHLGDLLPNPQGLPEGITQAELQRDYGGAYGALYKEQILIIEKRLDQCKLLNPK
jgi:hypothetical protein